MFALIRITPAGRETLETADSREDLEQLYSHYLTGPDGPVVGSRYADYDLEEVED